MTSPAPRLSLVCTALLVTGLLPLPLELEAQVRRGRATQVETVRWAPPSIGVRGGWDQRIQAEVLGAQARIPVVRSGIVELLPSAEVTYLQNSKDYQYGIEASWVPGGPRGGVFLSAGVAWRDTATQRELPTDPRDTFFGYVLAAGGKTRIARVELEFALRWVFLSDTDYRPNAGTVGLNFPFWRVGPRG